MHITRVTQKVILAFSPKLIHKLYCAINSCLEIHIHILSHTFDD